MVNMKKTKNIIVGTTVRAGSQISPAPYCWLGAVLKKEAYK